MSNISKSFEKKSALRAIRMADGGLVGEAKKNIGNRAATIDGAVDTAVRGAPAPAPAPAPAAPPPAPQSEDAKRAAVGMPPKKGFLRTMLGMAEGGHVVGPGGPREDKVPAMLSNGEYVLPAKTVQKLGGPEELDELVQQTNDGKPPKGAEERGERHSGLRKLAMGGVIEIGADGIPRTNGTSVPIGQRLATIPGQTATPIPQTGTSVVPYTQPAAATPTPVQPAAATPQPTQPAAAAAKPGMLSRAAMGGLRMVGKSLPIAVAQQGFGDYAPTDQSVPYDAMSQLRMGFGAHQQLLSGDFDGASETAGRLGKSLSNSFVSTVADVGSGVAKVADGVAGVFGASPGYKKDYDAAVASEPFFAGVRPAAALNSKAGAGRGFVNPPSLGVGDGPESLRTAAPTTDATPSPRNVAQSRFLSEQGVDAATQASAPVRLDIAGTGPNGVVTKNTGLRNVTEPGKFVNLGSFQGPDNIYGTSTKPGGRVDSFVGAGDPNRQESPQTIAAVEKLQNDLAVDRAKTAAREQAEALASATQGNAGSINARFDEMARGVKGSYSAKGKGNENKRLLEIEAQRANALEADSRNTAMLRGQSLQAQTQFNENATKNREISVRDAERRDALRAAGMPKALDVAKFNADQANKARENEEKGDAAVNKAVADSISRRFPGVKDDPTQAKQAEALAAFVRQAPPDIINRIRSQNPTEREEGIQLAFNMFDQTQKVNRSQAGSSNGISSDKPVLAKGESRGARLGDFAGPGSLSITDLGRLPASWLGMDYGKVQELDNGAKVPLSLLTDDEFGKNVTKVSSLAQQRELTRRREEQARIERLKQEIKK